MVVGLLIVSGADVAPQHRLSSMGTPGSSRCRPRSTDLVSGASRFTRYAPGDRPLSSRELRSPCGTPSATAPWCTGVNGPARWDVAEVVPGVDAEAIWRIALQSAPHRGTTRALAALQSLRMSWSSIEPIGGRRLADRPGRALTLQFVGVYGTLGRSAEDDRRPRSVSLTALIGGFATGAGQVHVSVSQVQTPESAASDPAPGHRPTNLQQL